MLQVGVQVRAELVVQDPLLQDGIAGALHDATVDLAGRRQRVDDPPHVVDGHDPPHAHLPGLDVDLHLGELGAKGVGLEPLRVRSPGAVADEGIATQLAGHLGKGQAQRRIGAVDDGAVAHLELVGADPRPVEHLGRQVEQLAFAVAGCGPHRRPGRGQRLAARAGGAVGRGQRVADHHPHGPHLHAQLLGRDLGQGRPGAGADVLHAGQHLHAAVAQQLDDGPRRRSAAPAPDLAGHAPSAAPRAAGAGRGRRLASLPPAKSVRALLVGGAQALGGVRGAALGVGLGIVLEPQIQRVEAEFGGQVVHGAFQGQVALHVARGAKGPRLVGVGPHVPDDGAHVGAGVEGPRRAGGREAVAAVGAQVRPRLVLDAGQRPVGASAEADALPRGRPVAAHELLLAPVEDQAHRPSRGPGGLGRQDGVHAGRLLGAKAAPHKVADDPHPAQRHAEGARHLVADGKDALGRLPQRQLVALPAGDAPVGLQRRVDGRRRGHCQVDGDLRLLPTPRHVAPLVGVALGVDQVARLVVPHARRVAGQRRLQVHGKGQHLVVDADGRRGGPGHFEAAGHHQGHLGPLEGDLLAENGPAAKLGHGRRLPAVPHQVHAVHGLGRRAVDGAHQGMGVGRAEDGGVQHARQSHVGGVQRLAGDPRRAIDARQGLSDDAQPGVLAPRLRLFVRDNDLPL